MKKRWVRNVVVALGVGCLMGCSAPLTVDNTPVAAVTWERYLGDWYEIARFDHWFERDMEQAKAVYTLRDDGSIHVLNSGLKNGRWKTATGRAKITATPGLLRVSFFGPFYSDYRVMWLDETYQHALIGSETDDYLWLLARTPQITPALRDTLLHEAQRRGYDTSRLIWVKHP